MKESVAVRESMVKESMAKESTAVKESTEASSDAGRGMVEYDVETKAARDTEAVRDMGEHEEAASTSAECPSHVETEAVRDTSWQIRWGATAL